MTMPGSSCDDQMQKAARCQPRPGSKAKDREPGLTDGS
jgi:hypothetical protein